MSIDDDSDPKFWLKLLFDKTTGNIMKPDQIEKLIKPENLPKIQSDGKNSTEDYNALLNRIRGSIFGLALGDALGAHVEFRPYEFMKANLVKDMMGGGTWGLEKGQFTDDTSMALCLANSLIASTSFDAYDQLVRYKWWYRHGYMSSTGNCFDIGAATRDSIEEFEKRQREFSKKHSIVLDDMNTLSAVKRKDFDVNCSKIGVAGNGALMRLCPVPLFFGRNPNRAVQYSGDSAIITHGDQKARDACRYYGALIVAALNGQDKNALLDENFYEKNKVWFGNDGLSKEVETVVKGTYKTKKGYEGGIRGRGYVIDSLEAALWAFYETDSFEAGALAAVNLGDDTDTTAAIYGQLAGAYYGYNKLPKNWLDVIYARKFLDCISEWICHGGRKWFEKTFPIVTAASDRETNSHKNDKTNHDRSQYEKYGASDDKSNKSGETPVYLMRNAINTSGRIGQLYDPSTDTFLGDKPVHLATCRSADFSHTFEILRGEQFRTKNVLHVLDIDPQLCLSIHSGLINSDGIAGVLDYPHLYSTNTYGFHYSSCQWESADIKPQSGTYDGKSDATHIITGIQYGIDVVVLLNLREEQTKSMETTLRELNKAFKQNTKLPSDLDKFDKDYTTYSYSNDPTLQHKSCKFSEICQRIKRKIGQSSTIPCTYMIHQIDFLYPSLTSKNQSRFIPIIEDTMKQLEEYLKYWSMLKRKNSDLQAIETRMKKFGLGNQYETAKGRCENVRTTFFKDVDIVKDAIVQIRRGNKRAEDLTILFHNDTTRNQIQNQIDDIRYDYVSMSQRLHFIKRLEDCGFEYKLAETFNIFQTDDSNSMIKKLKADSRQSFLLSNDFLNATHSHQLDEYLKTLHDALRQKKLSKLIYIDFSNTAFRLEEIIIYSIDEGHRKATASKNYPKSPEIQFNSSQENSSSEIPNILLIGAEKCGKSDIVNILHNYMESNPSKTSNQTGRSPRIAVSRSYSIEVEGHEPRLINLTDSCNDERVSMEGTSTTVKCRAHVIKLHCGRQIRIIDTPGFSRQSEEINDRLIDQISSHILDPVSLRAVCVVIQSNDKTLYGYDSFMKKFIKWFGPATEHQLIFCFTDYLTQAPCNLKRNSIPEFARRIYTLSFWKDKQPHLQMAFFDGQFFKHLATHKFSTKIENQFDMSRQLCQDGVNNLVKFIFEGSSGNVGRSEPTGSEHLNSKIRHFIRPILETIRNNYRNLLLLSAGPQFLLVELRPFPLKRMSAICMTCIRPAHQYSAFWILEDKLSDYHQDYAACGCSIMQQKRVDYELRYQIVARSAKTADTLQKHNHQLTELMISLGSFLGKKTASSQDDLFIQYLNRMISDETCICDNYSYSHYNGELAKRLTFLKKTYTDKIVQNGQYDYLQPKGSKFIHESINELMKIDDVRKQIEAFHILK